jgi:fused signal recognition particle receptor
MSLFSFFSKSNLEFGAIKQIFTHKKLSLDNLEDLENQMIISDVGVLFSAEIIAKIKNKKFPKNISEIELKDFLAKQMEEILIPCEASLKFDDLNKTQVLIFNGVNGVGKTTTIGKIAANLKNQQKKIIIAACDTFRAAAVEQLEIWAKRVDCEIIKPQKEGEDPAAVAYRAFDFAKKNDFDFLLIDTAGRLENKQNLMDELKKINAVLKKIDANILQKNLLIIDSTTGQNAKSQLEVFDKVANIDGLIITKLDGSAKGGVVIGLAREFKKPIYAIGVGEKIDDLQEFKAKNFVRNLLGFHK